MVRPFGSVSRTWKALAAVVAMAMVAVVLIATPGSATFAKKYDLVMSSTPSPVPVGTIGADQGDVHEQEPLLDRLGVADRAIVAVGSTPSRAAHGRVGSRDPSRPRWQSVSMTGLNLILNKPYTITMTVTVACDAATGSWGSTAKLFGGSTHVHPEQPGERAEDDRERRVPEQDLVRDARAHRTRSPAARCPR